TVTPVPDTVTAVAPVKLVPVIVDEVTEPNPAEFGDIEVMAGAGVTVKPVNGADVPPVAVTVNVRWVRLALFVTVIVTGSEVLVAPVPILAVTPDPINVTADAPPKPVPVIVAGTIPPCGPRSREIAVMVGRQLVGDLM